MDYYNENDPYAAQWLRNLIAAGHLPNGYVDERSITEVTALDLANYETCHFFAGIGVWSAAYYAQPWRTRSGQVWTGSCPCQPFSSAGGGAGFDDDRHLWPVWQRLIAQCKPAIVFGEQVASKLAEPWIDAVFTDLEALEYACGAVAFPSASVGAPHIRDRLYWMGHADDAGLQKHWQSGNVHLRQQDGAHTGRFDVNASMACGMADDHINGRIALPIDRCYDEKYNVESCGQFGGMVNAKHNGRDRPQEYSSKSDGDGAHIRLFDGEPSSCTNNSQWRDADWLFCKDGKWRPVRPGTFPLVDGTPGRVGRLRAYGNAVNFEQARTFIVSAYEAMATKGN